MHVGPTSRPAFYYIPVRCLQRWCQRMITLSTQNFKTQRNFAGFASKEREMYVCKCKIIAHAVTKQI